jgi:hypothetical protein
MAEDKGVLGLGILSGRGPLRRRMNRRGTETKENPKPEVDPLEELENSLNSLLSSFEQATQKSSCGLCRELVTKIKVLSLEDQKKAIPELRQFMALAEKAGTEKEIKEGLSRMPTLRKVLEG